MLDLDAAQCQLEEVWRNGWYPNSTVSSGVLLKTMDALIAELRKLREETRWIPVTERLPEEGMDVLVWWYGSHLRIGRYNGRDKSFVVGRYYAPDVTHWRPLPKPPEEGK